MRDLSYHTYILHRTGRKYTWVNYTLIDSLNRASDQLAELRASSDDFLKAIEDTKDALTRLRVSLHE